MLARESSTRMGHVLESPCVASLFHRSLCDHNSTNVLDSIRTLQVSMLRLSTKSEIVTFSLVFYRFLSFSYGCIHIVINRATLKRCDHTSTTALNPIKIPQLSILERDRGVLGWVTSWEILVLHLFFANLHSLILQHLTGVIIPTLMHLIRLELRSQACLGDNV
ncbi:hypothetical protein CR513_50474, partial [Mucuna pruriens]